MARLTTAEEILAAVPSPPPLHMAIGALPGAAPDSVVWLDSLTLSRVLFLHVQALQRDPKSPLADRQRQVLHAGLKRNVKQWRLYQGLTCGHCAAEAVAECPTCGTVLCAEHGAAWYCPDCAAKVAAGETLTPRPERAVKPTVDRADLVPLFECAEQAAALGDPSLADSAAGALLEALTVASGWPTHPVGEGEDKAETDYETWSAGLTPDCGRWVGGLFEDPAHEVYLLPMDEATRDLGQSMAAAADVCETGEVVPMRGTPYIIAQLLRTGPNGEVVMTQEQARKLPFGLAQAIVLHCYRIIPQGGAAVRAIRFRDEPAVVDEPGGAGLPAVVPVGEGTGAGEPVADDAAAGE